jgi:hypothetical protein
MTIMTMPEFFATRIYSVPGLLGAVLTTPSPTGTITSLPSRTVYNRQVWNTIMSRVIPYPCSLLQNVELVVDDEKKLH